MNTLLPANKKSAVLEQMRRVLDKDLEVLSPEERTLERWFSLLENEDYFANSKYKSLKLKYLLEELNSGQRTANVVLSLL